MSTPKLILFCALAVTLLPLTVFCAVLAALGGDKSLLRALRGKVPIDTDL